VEEVYLNNVSKANWFALPLAHVVIIKFDLVVSALLQSFEEFDYRGITLILSALLEPSEILVKLTRGRVLTLQVHAKERIIKRSQGLVKDQILQ